MRVASGPACTSSTNPLNCETAEVPKSKSEPQYFLGIIEFDDSGLLYAPEQLDFVVNEIKKRAAGPDHNGVIVVAMVHGWQHDAAPNDKNLAFFRKLLSRMAEHEKQESKNTSRKPRLVAGAYLAWHGKSMKIADEELTFYARRSTAYRIGQREATPALLRLRDAAYGDSPPASSPQSDRAQAANRFIVVGHSFGGALVYSALSQLLSSQLLCQPQGLPQTPPADSVILINPAMEAIQVLPLFRTVSDDKSCVNKANTLRPKLAIFTSDTDRATKSFFPLGGKIRVWLKELNGVTYRKGPELQNPLRKKSTSAEQSDKLGEVDADTRSIGHFDPLVTHFLVPHDHEMAEKARCSEDVNTDNYVLDYNYLNFGETCLVVADPEFSRSVKGFDKNLTPLNKKQLPIFNVKVDKQIWDGHALDQDENHMHKFLQFLEKFIPFSLGVKEF
jgi:hypothetical protein